MRWLLVLIPIFSIRLFAVDQCVIDEALAIFKQFKRPFTVLDLVHDNGQTARQLIDHCSGCYVIMQPQIQWIGDSAHNLVVLDYAWTPWTIRLLELCEDFDVVLLNEAVPVVQCDVQRLRKYCSSLGMITILINARDGHKPLMRTTRTLIHAFLYDQRRRYYSIACTFDTKKLFKKDRAIDWIAGINLFTFVTLHGIIPTQQCIIDSLYQQFRLDYEDPKAANVIVKGDSVCFIDTVLDSRWTFDKCYKTRLKRFFETFEFLGAKQAFDYQRLLPQDLALLREAYGENLPLF